MNSSQNPRPRTAQDERNQSRKEGKVKTVKTPRQAGYNNYNKYVKMQKKVRFCEDKAQREAYDDNEERSDEQGVRYLWSPHSSFHYLNH